MQDSNTQYWVGLDVHQSQITVAIVGAPEAPVSEFRVGGHPRSVRKLVGRLQELQSEGEVACAYEAGPTGYGLQRQLEAAGVTCQVVAPSLIARRPGERIKTDRRDARKLATHLRGGLLTAVFPPSPEQEAVRDLCRCRDDARADLMRCRHRLSKMLLRRERVYRDGTAWTQKHRRWLLSLPWEHEADRLSFASYLRAVEHHEERLVALDAALEAAAQKDPYREPVGWLRCFRGLDTLNALTLVAELYAVARFQTPRQLMAYLGLVVSEHTTGSSRRQGGITKTGNAQARRVLINAAWHCRRRPAVSRILRRRREGQPQEILALADRAMDRLHRRYWHLTLGRGKCSQQAVVAVARELAGFLWVALVQYPQLQASPAQD